MHIIKGMQESGSCRVRVLWKWVLLLVVVVSILLSGCDFPEGSKSLVVMSVGDRNISVSDLKRDLTRIGQDMGIPAKEAGAVLDQLLDRLVDHYLILEYGRDMGISITRDELEAAVAQAKREYREEDFQDMLLDGYLSFDEWKESLRDRLLIQKITGSVSEGVGPVTFKEIKDYFNLHRDEFSYPRMVKFRQIVTKSREQAEEILRRIEQGEDFGELARKYSSAPEGETGGEVGWIAEDDLEASMAKALFSLSPGQTSPIVETPYGYHIFEVLSTRPAGTRTLPEARPEIQRRLLYERRASFYRHWLKQLRTRYPVKINRKLVTKLIVKRSWDEWALGKP